MVSVRATDYSELVAGCAQALMEGSAVRVQGVPGCLAHRDVRRQRGTAIRTVCVGGAGDRHARICQLQALSAGQGDAIQPFLKSASVLIAATSKCFFDEPNTGNSS